MNDLRYQKMSAILSAVRKETNGAAVEGMARRGIRYPLNYGVASHAVKRIARGFYPDNSLADLLIRQEVRELQLAAAFIAEAAAMDSEKIADWARFIRHEEVMNHAVMTLFYRSPDAPQIAREWLDSDEPLSMNGGLRMAGRLFQHRSLAAGESDRLAGKILEGLASGRYGPSSALEFCLLRMASTGENRKRSVIDALARADLDGSSGFGEIAELLRYA